MSQLSQQIIENQEAAIRALNSNDLGAYRALAEQEARLMDEWRIRARQV